MKDDGDCGVARLGVVDQVDALAKKLTLLQCSLRQLLKAIRRLHEQRSDQASERTPEPMDQLSMLEVTSELWQCYLVQDAEIWCMRAKQLTWGPECRLVRIPLNNLAVLLEASKFLFVDGPYRSVGMLTDARQTLIADLRDETVCRANMWERFHALNSRLAVDCYNLSA